jgi:hypothetical protein
MNGIANLVEFTLEKRNFRKQFHKFSVKKSTRFLVEKLLVRTNLKF